MSTFLRLIQAFLLKRKCKYCISFPVYALPLPSIHFFIRFFNKSVGCMRLGARGHCCGRDWIVKTFTERFLLSGFGAITWQAAMTKMKTEKWKRGRRQSLRKGEAKEQTTLFGGLSLGPAVPGAGNTAPSGTHSWPLLFPPSTSLTTFFFFFFSPAAKGEESQWSSWVDKGKGLGATVLGPCMRCQVPSVWLVLFSGVGERKDRIWKKEGFSCRIPCKLEGTPETALLTIHFIVGDTEA